MVVVFIYQKEIIVGNKIKEKWHTRPIKKK